MSGCRARARASSSPPPSSTPSPRWVKKKERLETPENWAACQHAALGTEFWQNVRLSSPIQIFSCFAGTGADVQAAKKLLGCANLKVIGCDMSAASQKFFTAAHNPDHFWRDDAAQILTEMSGCCTLWSIVKSYYKQMGTGLDEEI